MKACHFPKISEMENKNANFISHSITRTCFLNGEWVGPSSPESLRIRNQRMGGGGQGCMRLGLRALFQKILLNLLRRV